uniref:(northern house mosquito) hypothetical protein n=1 Tax=Culex pipiens TaxID=7175 RepID=A0A8D8B6A0_CULPI
MKRVGMGLRVIRSLRFLEKHISTNYLDWEATVDRLVINLAYMQENFKLMIVLFTVTISFWEAGGFTVVNLAFLTDHIQQTPKLEKAFFGANGQMLHRSAE